MLSPTHTLCVSGSGGKIVIDQVIKDLNISVWYIGINSVTFLKCPKTEVCATLTCSLVHTKIERFFGNSPVESGEPLHVLNIYQYSVTKRNVFIQTPENKLFLVNNVGHQIRFNINSLEPDLPLDNDMKVLVHFSLYKAK
jgi:hypothetical protein